MFHIIRILIDIICFGILFLIALTLFSFLIAISIGKKLKNFQEEKNKQILRDFHAENFTDLNKTLNNLGIPIKEDDE